MKILQIGPISYVGGVSVHIDRLCYLFKSNSDNFTIKFVDESPLIHSKKDVINIRRIGDSIKFLKAILNSDIIHIHSVHWIIRIFNIACVVMLNKPFIVTLHSFRITGIKKTITLLLLRNAKLVIAVSKEIEEVIHSDKIITIVKEAFIPPQIENEISLPLEIEKRIDIEKSNKVLICANAFRLTPYAGGELYGLDQCIDVALKAKKNNLKILIIFVIGTIRNNDNLYLTLLNKFKEFELAEYLWIIPFQVSFINIIKNCSIVLRPTLSDGDALTIREALFLNKFVIASDVVNRPLGTLLYKTGNSNDLYEKIIECLNNNFQLDKMPSFDMNDYFNFYEKLYKTCNNSRKN
jgi:glycosyltransferase involved in cell wall biosynthesis